MTDIAENINTTDMSARGAGLILTIFRGYRENFARFWRIMMPVIIFGFLFDVGISFSDSFFDPENLWCFDTARGLFISKDPKSIGIDSGMIFGFHSFSIGWLWLTMCPLIFAVVEHGRNTKVTARDAWRRARSGAVPILVVSLLLYSLGAVALLGFLILTLKVVSGVPDSPYGSSLCLGVFLLVGGIIYLAVNWSLYNQIIVIEGQKSTTISLRRSSKLVRGIWGRVFGIYLLLALVTMVITSVLLGLTLLVFSLNFPEFAPLREVLLSVKFLTLFVGGYARISFESAPSFWSIAVVAMVNTLIHALLAPVWAILTTHLYRERTVINGQPSAAIK